MATAVTPIPTGTIAVAMSGGVDSSTVAAMLRSNGSDVVGLTLQLWDQNRLAGKPGVPEAPKAGRCCSLDDVYDAPPRRRDPRHPLLRRQPAGAISSRMSFAHSSANISRGARPSLAPSATTTSSLTSCCSPLARSARLTSPPATTRAMNMTRPATAGSSSAPPTSPKIRPGSSAASPRISSLTTLFPLGHLQKPAVREIAAPEQPRPRRDKPDSQEICFIPGGDYKQFIANYLDEQGQELPDSSGDFVTSSGEKLGHHAGIHNFTYGQRKGLGVTSPNPLYVLNIDAASHRVTLGEESELNSPSFRVKDLNWISIPELTAPMRVQAKIRHRRDPAWAVLTPEREGRAFVKFDEPQRAVTPGQCAVFYDGDEVVAGGWIDTVPS